MDGDWIESDIIEDTGIRYLTTGNIGSLSFKEQGSGYISENTFKKLNCLPVYPGDLAISRLNEPLGRACFIPNNESKYVVAVDIVILRPDKSICANYIRYYMNIEAYNSYVKLYSRGTTMPRVSRTILGNMPIPLPPLAEQQRIADYLDAKCAHIDQCLELTRQSMEKLRAYKLSCITEAVTKGLDPDVPLKDSGVPWIGQIPVGWQAVKLKYIMQAIIDCPHETPQYDNDGIYYVIRTADQDIGRLKSHDSMYRLNQDQYDIRTRRSTLEKNDIVYGREGERWGLACLVPYSNKYCLGQRMMQFRCKHDINSQFIMWQLNAYSIYRQGIKDTFGSTSPHVNISTIQNFIFLLPPPPRTGAHRCLPRQKVRAYRRPAGGKAGPAGQAGGVQKKPDL